MESLVCLHLNALHPEPTYVPCFLLSYQPRTNQPSHLSCGLVVRVAVGSLRLNGICHCCKPFLGLLHPVGSSICHPSTGVTTAAAEPTRLRFATPPSESASSCSHGSQQCGAGLEVCEHWQRPWHISHATRIHSQ